MIWFVKRRFFLKNEVNQNDTLDFLDATTLQRYLAEYEFPNHIGEIITQ